MSEAYLTLTEMSQVLDPPLTVRQLRSLIGALGIQPEGSRRTGGAGRPALCYRASEIMRLHAAVVPLMHPLGLRPPGVKAGLL